MILSLKELFVKDITNELFAYYKEQIMNLYNQLSYCNNVSTQKFIDFINRTKTFVYINERMEILGIISALYERKMIHNGGLVCHIEDLVVDEKHRDKSIGKQLLLKIKEDAKKEGVYKIILNCTEELVSYYEKCGFERKNVQMSLYFE
tara:strand:+ start:504 stop:947 length:444 start_codon:yes stop_codon:yes gene_type:complete